MSQSVIIHITNEDPIVGEVDDLPAASDTCIKIHNPRRRDGKDLHYLQGDVITVIWPMAQVAFIEVLPTEAEEQVIGFVRDS
jgi:hypothetical protein